MLHCPQLGGGAFTYPHRYRYSRRVRNALVAVTSPPALGLGCALGRHPPPTGSMCVLREHMHAGRRKLSGTCCPRAGGTAAAGSPLWSVRTSRHEVLCQKPTGTWPGPETLHDEPQAHNDVCPPGAAREATGWTDRHEQTAQRSRLAVATPAAPLAR